MLIQRLKSKIHRVTVTEANLNYVGSITIDEELMQAAGIIEGEKVQIVNNNNGERLETYVIPGPKGSGAICLNGAAARITAQSQYKYAPCRKVRGVFIARLPEKFLVCRESRTRNSCLIIRRAA